MNRIMIVGASLAGLRTAEALRDEGFAGELTVIGDEPHAPYDRPPLSKAVLSGWLSTGHVTLPRLRDVAADWLLGVAATGLDLRERHVRLADGRRVDFDGLVIATGTRARPWPAPEEAALRGVHMLRSRDDADRLRTDLAAGPERVLVIGGGFTGSEVAGGCRELGLDVTLTHRGAAPMSSARGGTVARFAADVQRAAGVDLRLGTTVTKLDATGRLRRAWLSDGTAVDVDVAVIALGAVSNVEWLADSGLMADARGAVCDTTCRALTEDGSVADGVFVAGDVARWPHPLYPGNLVRLDHWGNAVSQAKTVAHNMTHGGHRRHDELPAFWSNQFGVNLKSVGLPTYGDEVVITQGSLSDTKFVAVYGRDGRTVAAVAVNAPRQLDGYAELITAGTPFPPAINAPDGPAYPSIVDAEFPQPLVAAVR